MIGEVFSMEPVCDIIIVSYNQKEYTKACIESIHRNTRQPFRIIVLDNASEAGTLQYLSGEQEAGRISLVRLERNLGWVGGVNEGLSRSNAEFVCVMNNDTVAYPGWLAEMIAVAQSDARIGIVNPVWSVPKRYPFSRDSYVERFVYPRRGKFIRSDWARGFCFLAKRAVIDRIGGLDPEYAPGYYDDWDFSMRAAQEGFTCALALGAFVWHHISVSFRPAMGDHGINAMLAAKGEIFYRKWGFPLKILAVLKRGESLPDGGFSALVEEALTKQARVVEVARDAQPARHTNFKQFPGPMVLVKAFFIIIDDLRHSKKKRFDLIICSAETRARLLRLIPRAAGYRFMLFDECAGPGVFRARILELMSEKAQVFSGKK